MKSLTLAYIGGAHEDFTVEDAQASEAVQALTTQQPAHPIRLSDTAIDYVNMRHVACLRVTDASGEVPTPVQEEALAEESEVSESDTDEDTRTVAELKAALDGAGVEYDSKALKADLLELAQANGV